MSQDFGSRTTLRVGGPAASVLEVESIEDLRGLASTLQADDLIYVLGRGSNTLVADAGFRGTVVHLSEAFSEISISGTTVTAGGAADRPVVARRTAEAGLTGFEWAVGVPGSVGGGVAMNAGGHGSDMAASVRSVEIFDLDAGATRALSSDDLAFSYRHSSLSSRHVVLSCTLELARGDAEQSREMIKDIVRWRRANQPGGANCGSVFTNPTDDSAGRLIESAGLKGRSHGSAHVSEKHANFIQASPEGSADDVVELMREIVDAVRSDFGVTLRSEVRLVGFPDEVRVQLMGGQD